MLVPRNQRLARFDVSVELLAQSLHLPDGACICDVRMLPNTRHIEVFVQDDQLPPVAEGSIVPGRAPELREQIKQCGCKETHWSWGT